MLTIEQGIMQLISIQITSCLAGNPTYQLISFFGTNTADLKGNTSAEYVENLKGRIEWV